MISQADGSAAPAWLDLSSSSFFRSERVRSRSGEATGKGMLTIDGPVLGSRPSRLRLACWYRPNRPRSPAPTPRPMPPMASTSLRPVAWALAKSAARRWASGQSAKLANSSWACLASRVRAAAAFANSVSSIAGVLRHDPLDRDLAAVAFQVGEHQLAVLDVGQELQVQGPLAGVVEVEDLLLTDLLLSHRSPP